MTLRTRSLRTASMVTTTRVVGGVTPRVSSRNDGSSCAGASDTQDRVVALAIGDVHGYFEPLFAAVAAHPDAVALLQVGDLTAGKPGRELHPDGDPVHLQKLPIPLLWIHGNHEHWHLFRPAADGSVPTIPGNHIWPGRRENLPGTAISVVGLPGNYAPTWFNQAKPFPNDRARHFSRGDIEAMARNPFPNILLMHESFRGQAPGTIGTLGIPVLSTLVRDLAPTLVLTGHHHTLAVTQHGPTLAMSLPPAWEGYMRLTFWPSGALASWDFIRFPDTEQSSVVASDTDGLHHVPERVKVVVPR